ncbi:hypothetical protein QZH41_007934 [Actinostola sp. cb2023]|nr:hypothetical protein QZH41_007934 [Actinostola sp. cb2023]
MLEEKVVTDGKISMFIVIRRGVPVNRAITLWQRASQKVNPVHVCRIKFIGEDGIDDGALAREFFAYTVPDIAKKFFPDGSPVYSTNDIASYRAIGEIVAASLAQGGPAPNFLAPCVYDTLASAEGLNYTSTTEDLQKHLTESELKLLEGIREDVATNTDTILEHSYTGPITEAHVESIVAAVTVSILSRRELMLKELKKGLELYDFATIITKHPQVCKNLFITDQQQPVDPDYLFSLLKPEYSDVGSTRRSIEESVMDNFQDLLFSLEDDSPVSAYREALAWKAVNADADRDGDDDDNDGDERFTEADLSPAAVMGWLTGQRHRDITKKIPIYVKFDHDCKKRNPKHSVCFPIVRACGREVTFPVAHMSTADEFKNNFSIAFCKGQAFSRV